MVAPGCSRRRDAEHACLVHANERNRRIVGGAGVCPRSRVGVHRGGVRAPRARVRQSSSTRCHRLARNERLALPRQRGNPARRSPRYGPRSHDSNSQLPSGLVFGFWVKSCYSELTVNNDLLVVELTNPQLRQLAVARRRASLNEAELIHTPPSQYSHTRTWARFLHASLPALQGLCWRPRLGGTGLAYMLFGDRCAPRALTVTSGPIDIDSGSGFVKAFAIAQSANIKIIG